MDGFKELPILFVNSWDELTYNRLQDFYDKVQSQDFNLNKMKISYWKQTINEKLHI